MLSIVFLMFTATVPIFAQVDLTGVWVAQYHEDQPERILGPELGDYLGVPINAAAPEHFLRHGNYLTMVTIVSDPVYLTEPFLRSSDYLLDPSHVIPPYPCEAVVEVNRPAGCVPHHLPGTNKYVGEFTAKHGAPAEAARGGAETMYPEYRLKMSRPNTPARETAQK